MTRLVDTQQALAPTYQQQGPDSNCIIDGKLLGWDSCTAYSMAMLIDRATAGKKQPSGCSVRRYTKDTTGGLTLNQVAYVAETQFGVPIDVRVGSNVVKPSYVARQVRAGRPAVIQGDAIGFVPTKWRSTRGAVSHAVMLNAVRGGSLDEPAEGLVYDPAADGEKHGWGTADQGPSWIPWGVIKKFMASLRPGGPGTPMIGGWCYAAFGPDTEPHVSLRKDLGGVKSNPFPDRTRAAKDIVWIHSVPKKGNVGRKYSVKKGVLLVGYQYVSGDSFQGSSIWLGNDDGNEFVHIKNLSHFGGDT